MCVCVCMYVCMCVCSVFVCVWCVCVCVWCVCVCVVCVCVYVCMYVYLFVCVCVCIITTAIFFLHSSTSPMLSTELIILIISIPVLFQWLYDIFCCLNIICNSHTQAHTSSVLMQMWWLTLFSYKIFHSIRFHLWHYSPFWALASLRRYLYLFSILCLSPPSLYS